MPAARTSFTIARSDASPTAAVREPASLGGGDARAPVHEAEDEPDGEPEDGERQEQLRE